MKEFRKSANNWCSYDKKFAAYFFDSRCIIINVSSVLHLLAFVCCIIKYIFLDLEGGSQKATLVVLVLVVVVISSRRVQKSLRLSSYAAERNETLHRLHIRADVAHRSTVYDFSLIFSLLSN